MIKKWHLTGQKLSFWSKKPKFLLKSSQKRQLLQIGRRNPFQNGVGWINRQFWYIKLKKKNIFIIPLLEPTRGFFSALQKIQNFASPVGILGNSIFWNFGSPKIRNNGRAPHNPMDPVNTSFVSSGRFAS